MIVVPAAASSGTISAAVPWGRARKTASTGGSVGVDVEAGAREVGVRRADRLGVASAALEPDDLDVRVAAEEPDQARRRRSRSRR